MRRRAAERVRAWLLAAAALSASACESTGVEEGLDFERMVVQPRLDAYEAWPLGDAATAMRRPPVGTVPWSAADEAPDLPTTTGLRDSTFVEHAPIGYAPAVLELGRDHFATYCAPCHGLDGTATTPVALAITLVPPPALTPTAMPELPDGRVFRAITYGYGLMPSYAAQLPLEERWAVAAYLRALRLAHRVRLDDLPVGERARLRALADSAAAGGTP